MAAVVGSEARETRLDLEWMCMTRTDHVSVDLLHRMAAAGCVEIVFGVESCSPAI